MAIIIDAVEVDADLGAFLHNVELKNGPAVQEFLVGLIARQFASFAGETIGATRRKSVQHYPVFIRRS